METTAPTSEEMTFAEVLLDDAIDRPLDYRVPEGFRSILKPGIRVKVPVKKSVRIGTVLRLKATSLFAVVQPIAELLCEETYLSAELFQLAHWMAQYYCTPLRKILQSMLPASIRQSIKHKEQFMIKPLYTGKALIAQCEELRMTHPMQAQVIDVILKAPGGILLSQLLAQAKVSKSPVTTLIKKKILACSKVQIDRSVLEDYEYFPTQPKRLNKEQQEALTALIESLQTDQFATHLLFGVTGSGKTEVYLQAMSEALSQNKGIIFLVPEIALTSQTIERLRGRFKEKITVLHHRLSAGERHDAWHQIRTGQAPIVVGARSAIFSPVPRLGLIIVDEEQEAAYKQLEESPSYHARDVAVMRGKFSGAVVLLGSATPSFESYRNALLGKYRLNLLSLRADHATLPTVQIVDMREELKKNSSPLFSDPLIGEIEKRLEVGEQTILFLNRRGYRTAQMCPQCAHVMVCPHCDTKLTFHLNDNQLSCHLCDYQLSPPPRECPQCHSQQGFQFKGAGTELVERSLHALFPQARTLRLDADTTRHKGSHERLFKQFKAGKADILIGTQMIAKGLHFPSVTLVGILNADNHLQVPDFRASEQVFQLITQVAGRSGRGVLPGKVLIQTRMPDHPVIQLAAKQDYETFFAQENGIRELFRYPPFTRLIKLVFTSQDKGICLSTTQYCRSHLIQAAPTNCELLPIIPCGHAKINGRYRFQFMMKGKQLGSLLKTLSDLRAQIPRKVHLFIDIDPLSTFF